MRRTTARGSYSEPVAMNPAMPHIARWPLTSRAGFLGSRPRRRRRTQTPFVACRSGRPAVSCESAVGRETYGRSTRRGERSERPWAGRRFGQLVAVLREGQRSAVDERRGHDSRGTGNERNDVVEVVVIPVPAEPRRIRRVRVRDWRQPDDQDRENGSQHAAQPQHAPMIVTTVGQVKERCFGPVRWRVTRSSVFTPLRNQVRDVTAKSFCNTPSGAGTPFRSSCTVTAPVGGMGFNHYSFGSRRARLIRFRRGRGASSVHVSSVKEDRDWTTVARSRGGNS